MIPSHVTLVNAAVLLLFTTEPSDRALEGWCCEEWLAEERYELEQAVRQAARGEAA